MKWIKSLLLGGQPVKYDDFDFAVKEAMSDLAKAVFGFLPSTTKVCVLNGCDVTIDGSDLTMTAGWVYYNNEVFQVDTVNIEKDVGEVAVWQMVESYDSRGNKTFKDETVQDTYLVRKFTVVYKTLEGGDLELDGDTDYYGNYNSVPVGAIIMWSGENESKIPFGFTICDGRSENGFTTPDFRDRMLRGADLGASYPLTDPGNRSEGGSDEPYKGGSWEFTLAATNIPSHRHGINLSVGTTEQPIKIDCDLHNFKTDGSSDNRFYGDGSWFNDGNRDEGIWTTGHWHTISNNTDYYGSGTAKEYIPKYVITLFIMRTK